MSLFDHYFLPPYFVHVDSLSELTITLTYKHESIICKECDCSFYLRLLIFRKSQVMIFHFWFISSMSGALPQSFVSVYCSFQEYLSFFPTVFLFSKFSLSSLTFFQFQFLPLQLD